MEGAPCCAAALTVIRAHAAAIDLSILLNFISIRATLRFYCQIGLITSQRNTGQNGLRQSALRDRRRVSV
jgi:hypothetical protein